MTITVTQLNNYIRGLIDIDTVLNDVTVCGEITNVKRARDGWYFSLKDDDSAINCFCYASSGEPITGTVTVVEGGINFFTRTGSVSLFAKRLTATIHTGAAYLKFVELKEKLQKEGLFDEQRKKRVPHCAKKIGIVTSETGAVIHDITNVSLRRQPFTNLLLYPVKVQGAGADQEIAEGIAYFNNTDVDVVIVGRGGGSNEDLSVFNSEIVVRAVASCAKPVVSAVGHGIDFTLCDFAADKRAVTPTEAAEFVTLDVEREKIRLKAYLDRISGNISARLQDSKQRVAYNCKVLYLGIDKRLAQMQNKIALCLNSIESSVKYKTERLTLKLDKTVNKLSTLNPMSVLQRGYGYVSTDSGVVKTVNQVEVGHKVQIELQDGKLSATVTDKETRK